MRFNMKKALAVLLTLVMLCGLLPLGAITSVSAATNLVSNGTFESNTSGWSTSSTITRDTSDPGSGSASLKVDCTTVDYAWTLVTVQVETNTDYVLTFKGKTASAGLMVNFQSNWADISAQIPRYTVGSSSSWKDCEYEFNTGSYSSIMIYFQSSWAKGANSYFWIDDVSVAKKETEIPAPSGENLLVNGNFETGDKNGWSCQSGTSNIVTDAHSGSYALQLANPGQWGNAATQIVDVEPGAKYTITWYSKRVSGSGAFNLYFADNNNTDDKTLVTSSGQNWMASTESGWTQHSLEITINGASTTKLLVKFSSEVASAGTILLDDIVLTKNPDASFDGFLYNGDFEVGSLQNWDVSQSTVISASAAHSGSYGAHLKGDGGWGGMLYQQTVGIEAGKTYTISMWMKTVATGANVKICKNNYDGDVLASKWFTSTSWTQLTWTITPDVNVIAINFCGGGNGNVESVYVDDILIVEEKDPSFDGYITNGDFETGKTHPWVVHQSTAVSTIAAYEGSFGLNMSGTGKNYGGLAYQTVTTLKTGKEYTISMWLKVVKDGVNVQVLNGSTTGDKLAYNYYDANSAGTWKQITLSFTAISNTIVLNFCGSGNDVANEIYVDNVTLSRVGGEVFPEELHKFGGISIRDAEDTAGTGKGLAFKFDITASNGQKDYYNKYVSNSAKITLDEIQYDVVRMGAVMTNDASVGQNASKFNLDAVNNKKVINVAGEYLAGLTSESVSFAVRILDIPENHIGTTIYARPYYVYKENGQEIVVYGGIKSDTYAKAANPKSSIKILSIGHSFSKDVMDQYLWDMFKKGGYDEVVIGYLYMAGCSMPKHLYNIQNNLAQYEYGKNTNGTWVKKNNSTALYALQDEEWDYVNIQSSPDYIGGQAITGFKLGVDSNGQQINLPTPMTEYECITPITDWIQANAKNSSVKTDYHMIWSFSQGCDLWSGTAYHQNPTTHQYDQMVMYNNIITQTKKNVLTHDAVYNIIPCGTSIQNARTSFIGDNFNEPDATQGGNDGYHLNSKYGDYTAALTWYCHYSGDDANVMAGYIGQLTNAEFKAIAEAVNNAIEKWDEVTESTQK